ncbi:MAG: hypothetical protein HDS97_02805 [Bacteroidales bacterium]|nr:hypothetical protein [Bacteroidales bacterium]
MKNFFYVVILLGVALSQTSCSTHEDITTLQNKVDESKIFFCCPEQQAEYLNGGNAGLLNDLYSTLLKTQPAIQDSVTARAVVKFSISKNGIIDLNSIKIIANRNVPEDYLDAAIEAIKGLGTFEPGKMNGIPKKVTFNLPIIYPVPLEFVKTKTSE